MLDDYFDKVLLIEGIEMIDDIKKAWKKVSTQLLLGEIAFELNSIIRLFMYDCDDHYDNNRISLCDNDNKYYSQTIWISDRSTMPHTIGTIIDYYLLTYHGQDSWTVCETSEGTGNGHIHEMRFGIGREDGVWTITIR